MSEFSTYGMRELFDKMDTVAPKVRKNIARGMVHLAARDTRDAMRAAAPIYDGPPRKQQAQQGREAGNLRKMIMAIRRRGQYGYVRSTVTIKAFYWRFVEYGHGGKTPAPPHPFLRPAWDGIKNRLIDKMIAYARERFDSAIKGP